MPARERDALLESMGTPAEASTAEVRPLRTLPANMPFSEREAILNRFGYRHLSNMEIAEMLCLVIVMPMVLVGLYMAWNQLPHVFSVLLGAIALAGIVAVMQHRNKAQQNMLDRGKNAGYDLSEAL
jgi:hypothetical protein